MPAQYTVHFVSKQTGISEHTIRYYDNEKIIQGVSRDEYNTRIFSEDAINWLYLIHALRSSGFSIKDIRRYIKLWVIGDRTIPDRYDMIIQQEHMLLNKIEDFKKQLSVLSKKKDHYAALINRDKNKPICNPKSI